MRVSISGCPGNGKSDYIEQFLETWPMYKVASPDVGSYIKEHNINIIDPEQKDLEDILSYYADTMMKYTPESNVIFHGSPIDCIVRTIYATERMDTELDELFVHKTIQIARNLFSMLDVMFLFPITKSDPDREVTFSKSDRELDCLYKGILSSYLTQDDTYFPKEDCAPVIEMFGTDEQRIAMTKMYISESGEVHGDDASLINNALEEMGEDFGDQGVDILDGSGNSVEYK